MKSLKLGTLGIALSTILAACGSTTTPLDTGSTVDFGILSSNNVTAEFTPTKNLNEQIVNGTVSAPGSRPYQVRVFQVTHDGGVFVCGGTLISPEWVLTAAHCLVENNGEAAYTNGEVGQLGVGIYVRGGTNNWLDKSAPLVKASNFFIHPEYNRFIRFQKDIGLIQLNRPLVGPNIIPAALPNDVVESVLDVPGRRAVASGWGDPYFGAHQQSDALKEVELPIVPNATTCGGTSVGNADTICGLPEGGKGTCQGDSGGPLAQQYKGYFYVLGITSYAAGCGNGSIFTRVNAYLPWIESISGIRSTLIRNSDYPNPPVSFPGQTTYVSQLTQGQYSYAPSWRGFAFLGGTLQASLTGPEGSNFNLYLQRNVDGTWQTVAQSAGGSSSEYIGVFVPTGTYRWVISSAYGNGVFELKETQLPAIYYPHRPN